MSSILTNSGAMTALQTLRSTNRSMADTQNQIATGKKVANAKDNAAFYAVSQVMKSDVAGFKSINESLSQAKAAVSVASAGAETVSELLVDLKSRIVAAQDGTSDQAKMQTEINEIRNQINETISASQFNGLNLLTKVDGNETAATAFGTIGNDESTNLGTQGEGLSFIASLNRADGGATVDTAQITVEDLFTGGMDAFAESDSILSRINVDPDATGGADTDAANALADVEQLIQRAAGVAGKLGAASNRIDQQSDFLSKISDAVTEGVGGLVDANMEEASARLQALQVQQQLGVQALSMANQAPQSILSLFR